MGHFLTRMLRGGQDAASTEFELGLGGLLGLLAAPGAFNCFLLLDKYSSLLNFLRRRLHEDFLLTSLPDKYLFIALAMAVTGIVTVLKWDQLLPDSQDYLNLAPLPIGPRRIVLANAMAVLMAVVVVATAVNGLPTLLFPLFVTAASHSSFGSLVEFSAIHLMCVMLASCFTICGLFALLGMLAAVLPREAFRACSSWIRGVLLIALIMLLVTGFTGSALVRHVEHAPDSLLRYLPSLWFLGLYQDLHHRASPLLASMGRTGLMATGAAFVLMVATYGLSCRKRFASVLERGKRPGEQRLIAAVLAVLDLFSRWASGFERACHRFTVRALLRGESHRLAIAVAVGLGWLMALQDSVRAWPAPLEAPLETAYLLVLGLRLAFELPAGISANWIFRAVLDPRERETLLVGRLVMVSFLMPLVWLPAFIYACWAWGWPTAGLHLFYVMALSICLVELQLAGYRKIPLTCAMPGFRENLPMLCLVQFLGFELFTRGGAAMEQWMLRMPVTLLAIPIAMAGAWYWNRERIRDAREAGEWEEGMTFENAPVRAVERLNLSDGL